MKKRFVIVFLVFIILTFLESGILMDVLSLNGLSWGTQFMVCTEAGKTGLYVLVYFIPVSILIMFLTRITLCIKKRSGWQEFCLDCICALFGIGIGICATFDAPFQVRYADPFYMLGIWIADFLIDFFDWMRVMPPG
ncbi:hypothetical protein D7V83_00085 [bacterium 0.1xD8-71]|nr:hypothetical protein D7V83_00085 [bacterium 0.1xD8-71]